MDVQLLIKGIAALAATAPAIAMAQAPFCVVSSFGNDCSYYSADLCQQTANSRNGMCITSPKKQAAQSSTDVLDVARYVSDQGRVGAEQGRSTAQARMEAEEHAARMRVLRAQEAAAISGRPIIQATYSCTQTDGSSIKTDVPAIGCVVVAVRVN